MREAQVLCVVSYSETFGIVYAEAMKQGTAVVARAGTGIDGMGEDHKHYELISRDADLKPLLKNLLEHPAHCRLIAERGRELGRAWSWELSAQRLHELYRKCL
jgi:glycosyltransferase involved in cell wall biosynthesis